jgi:hypothetical protein
MKKQKSSWGHEHDSYTATLATPKDFNQLKLDSGSSPERQNRDAFVAASNMEEPVCVIPGIYCQP